MGWTNLFNKDNAGGNANNNNAQGDPNNPNDQSQANNQQNQEPEPMQIGGTAKKRDQIISFYDQPTGLPDNKYTEEEKRNLELLRRWKVHIFQIEIQNTSGAIIDPFIQFIIGGTFYIEIKKANGKEQNNSLGEYGIIYQTDVLKFLEPNDSKFFTVEIDTELRASYFQLMQERLHIELWDKETGWLNKFLGYVSIPFIEIATGQFKQSIIIKESVAEGKSYKNIATINFNIFFEEIWDFYLTFLDWKATSLEKEEDKNLNINPQLELRLLSDQAIQSTAWSSVQKNQKLPHWATFEDGIKFRGTYNELRQQKLSLRIWNHQLLGKTLIGLKTVVLKHYIDTNLIKAEVVIHKVKNKTEENIRNKAQTSNLQGTLRIGSKPKYQQSGEMEVIAKREHYLVIFVNKLNVFDSIEDGGEASVFATVEWAGTMKRTRPVRRPNLNEMLFFNIPIEENIKNDPAKLTDFLNDELETKSEITFNVWADTGKINLENLGSTKVCLSALHNQKFDDKVFTDEKTKQKIRLSMWFQPEVPYPGVDLNKLRPKDEDTLPPDLEHGIRSQKYQIRFKQIIQKNFPFDYYLNDRQFDNLTYTDQYKSKHLLPMFLSKITPPDSTYIDFDSNESGSLIRGIRTLGEVAHFVRCIPFKNHEVQNIWSSPDFLLTMRIGSIDEHALLMASMFRAVKFETIEDIEAKFEQKKLLALEKAKQTLQGELEDVDFENNQDDNIEADEIDQQNANNQQQDKKKLKISKETPIDSKLLQQATVQQAIHDVKKKKKKKKGQSGYHEEEENAGINDRVFVCLGKLKESGQSHSWVMTLNHTYDEVTFWDVNQPKKYVLNGRIVEGEEMNLQGYLSPNLTDQEKKQLEKYRQLQREESAYFSEMNKSMNESRRSGNSGNIVDGDEEGKEDFLSSQESKEITDDEKESDSDFMDQMDKLVYFEDLDQRYKGGDINLVGKLKALSKEKQDQLKELDYFSDEDDDKIIQKKPVSKFLEKQQKERIEREKKRVDKHIWPVETFYDKRYGRNAEKVVLPYSQIDVIFNHKNIWANLQNPNPAQIYFHLHNESQWLPLISDLNIKHPLILQEELELKKQLEEELKPTPANLQNQENDKDQTAADKEKLKKQRKGKRETLLDYKIKGDYLKPFFSFYDPKALDQPYSFSQIDKYEKIIQKDLEIALKQVRSSKNLSTKIRKNMLINKILRLQLDFIEDQQCERLSKDLINSTRDKLNKELIKLIPENYKIMLLPSFFNYTDAERIKSVIADQATDFILVSFTFI
eukprot:403347806